MDISKKVNIEIQRFKDEYHFTERELPESIELSKYIDHTLLKLVIGFPLGAVSTDVKVFETNWCLEKGAEEFDMVINVGNLKAALYNEVYDDIKAVVDASKGKIVKVIIETALLTDEEKVAACVIAKEAGAHFVKTSTGFSKSGATVEDVSLMKFVVGNEMKVKASGGVRSKEIALAMIKAGADRIGTSSGIKIVNE